MAAEPGGTYSTMGQQHDERSHTSMLLLVAVLLNARSWLGARIQGPSGRHQTILQDR